MKEHPITPPTKLIAQWIKAAPGPFQEEYIAIQAARWGADTELEACCEVLARELICDGKHVATDLRTVRRPKPPSLKEQALDELDRIQTHNESGQEVVNLSAIRRALEQLPD